jgi:P27 family predicted phage terminase small subunit
VGKRGPAPTPTKLKLLRGEKREERLNRKAPKPGGGKPVMPSGMSPEAKKVWRRQMKAMGATGVLTVVDADSLRAYCEAVTRYEHAAEMLESSGPLVKGARVGELVKNPLHHVARDNAMLIRLFARDLGFLPSAREGLHARDEKEQDPLESWMQSSGSIAVMSPRVGKA